jgi:AraC-like DNA-binding protein
MTGACCCTFLRKATRKRTSIYDDALAPVGVNIAQFSLLRNVERGEPVSLTELGQRIELDRSTVGRNVKVLVKSGLIARAGGQSQFSTLLELEPKSDRVQSALTYAKQNLHRPLTVEELAEAARLSPRQFFRVFHAETGQSPAKAIENLRVEAARLMMERSRHPVDVVADQTGFADRNRMRRAFLRAFGQPPQVIRRNARGQLMGATEA